MSVLLQPFFNDIKTAIDQMRGDLLEIDALTITSAPIVRDRAARIKSWIFVWLAACLEEFLKKLPAYILGEITNAGIPCQNVRLSLFSIYSGNHFDGVKSANGIPMWNKRLDVLAQLEAATAAVFNPDYLKLDGRTSMAPQK